MAAPVYRTSDIFSSQADCYSNHLIYLPICSKVYKKYTQKNMASILLLNKINSRCFIKEIYFKETTKLFSFPKNLGDRTY